MTSRRCEKQNDEQNYFGIFSGTLQMTPLTRNLAPRFHLKVRGREGEEKPSRRKGARKTKCNFKNQGDIMHACNKMTCNKKTSNSKRTRGSYIYSWDVTNAPSSRNRAPRFEEEEKKEGKVQVASLSERCDHCTWGTWKRCCELDARLQQESNRMLVEREIFLEVKRTRDQLHGPELESTLVRLSRRYKR